LVGKELMGEPNGMQRGVAAAEGLYGIAMMASYPTALL